MPETKPTLSLHRKLAQVMHEAGRIPKNGTAPAVMGGYKFVQVGDAADAIREALAAQLITMMPTAVQVVGQVDRPTAKGGTMTTVDLITTWTLTDAESGESIEIQSFGAGADGGDKYSGKASTSAMKYALLTGFLLSTGEDSELGSHTAVQRPSQDGGLVDGLPKNTPEGGLIGTATVKDRYDFNLRQSPDTGWALPFRIKNGTSSFGVVAEGDLAHALDAIKSTVIDRRVTVWGTWSDEVTPAKGTRPAVKWRLLHLTRIATPDGILPAPAFDSREPELPEPPDDEPPTVLFSDEEQARLDAAVEKAGAA